MVRVGKIIIGNGRPKICASITETTQKAIIAAGDILLQRSIDIVEWRLDYFEESHELSRVLETLHRLRMSLGDMPILISFRTKEEGGVKQLPREEYENLLLEIGKSKMAELIDVEIFYNIPYSQEIGGYITENQDENQNPIYNQVQELKKFLQKLQENVLVVGSYHNFQKTPDYKEIIGRLEFMDKVGADLPKLAVMPENRKDVLTLMEATLEAKGIIKEKPLITMSMSGLGSISRLAGETFGSSVTFGCVGQASAPGQIAVNRLGETLDLIHSIQ